MIDIMTGKLAVIFIIGGSTIITAIMHGNEFKKTDTVVELMMLKIMRNELRKPDQLTSFSITGKVNTNQEYNQGFSHYRSLNIQK